MKGKLLRKLGRFSDWFLGQKEKNNQFCCLIFAATGREITSNFPYTDAIVFDLVSLRIMFHDHQDFGLNRAQTFFQSTT